jgi:hypothetical protein
MLENGNSFYMPVAPAYANNGGGFGGGFGGDWGWIILLLLLCGGGMWGMGGGFGMDGIYPWLNNSQNINDGFRDQMLNTSVSSIQNSITSGFGDVQTALCGGFAGVNATVNGAQNAITQQMYSNQIADLERSFAAQTANTQGLNNIQSQLSNCCCANQLATVQTQNLVASDGAATRLAIQNQTQAILDKMCQQEIDAYKRENDNLRSMVNMQNLAASQAAQTAAIIADNTSQTQYIVNRVAPYPIPAYTVPAPTVTI